MKTPSAIYAEFTRKIQTPELSDAEIFKGLTALGEPIDLLDDKPEGSLLFNAVSTYRWGLVWALLASTIIRTDNLGSLRKTHLEIQQALGLVSPPETEFTPILLPEVWLNIFPHLSVHERGRLSRVCRALHDNNYQLNQLNAEFPATRLHPLSVTPLNHPLTNPITVNTELQTLRTSHYDATLGDTTLALFAAVASGNLPAALTLLASGNVVENYLDYVRRDGISAYELAYRGSNLAIFLALLQHAQETVISRTTSLSKMFDMACSLGALEIFQFLLLITPPQKQGPEKLIDLPRAFYTACSRNRTALANYLLKTGIPIDLLQPYGLFAPNLLHILLRDNNWNLLHAVLTYKHLREDNLGMLATVRQTLLQLNQGTPAANMAPTQPNTTGLTRDVWRFIFSLLPLKNQLRLSHVSKLFRTYGQDVVQLFYEFREAFERHCESALPVNASQLLRIGRDIAYPENVPISAYRQLFASVARGALADTRSHIMALQRDGANHFAQHVGKTRETGLNWGERFTVMKLAVQADNIAQLLYLQTVSPYALKPLYTSDLLEVAQQYSAINIIQFLLLAKAAPLPDLIDPVSAFEKACHNNRLAVIKLLAPMVSQEVLSQCLKAIVFLPEISRGRAALHTAACLVLHGALLNDATALRRLCVAQDYALLQAVLTPRLIELQGTFLLAKAQELNHPQLFAMLAQYPEYQKNGDFQTALKQALQPGRRLFVQEPLNLFCRAIQSYHTILSNDIIQILFDLATTHRLTLALIRALIPENLAVNEPLPRLAVTYGPRGEIPLVFAITATNEDNETVTHLLDHGAHFQLQALYGAIIKGKVEWVQHLIALPDAADAIHEAGLHLILCACNYGNHKIITLLLEAFPRLQHPYLIHEFLGAFYHWNNEIKPLSFAVVDTLLARGMSITEGDQAHGNTPLHYAAIILSADSTDGTAQLVERLLAQGANPHALNREGNTPLHLACHPKYCIGTPTANEVDTIRLLLQHGARVDVRNAENKSPLDYALDIEISNARVGYLNAQHGAMICELLTAKGENTPPETEELLTRLYRNYPECCFYYHPEMAVLKEIEQRIRMQTVSVLGWNISGEDKPRYHCSFYKKPKYSHILPIPKAIDKIVKQLERVKHSPYPESLAAVAEVCRDIHAIALHKVDHRKGPTLFSNKPALDPAISEFYQGIMTLLAPQLADEEELEMTSRPRLAEG